jgi:hypothetical protein
LNKSATYTKFLICVFALLTLSGCNKKLVPADRQNTIVIDGKADEWNRDFFHKASNYNLIYAYTISNNNLNILLKGMDDVVARKMLVMGMTVWLDGKGKKNKRQGIAYPNGIIDGLAMKRMMERAGRRPGAREDRKPDDEALQILERNKSTIGLIGFFDNSKKPFIYSFDQLNVDIQAVINRVSANEVIIELSVPLSLIKKTNKKGLIGIGIETNTINLQEMITQQMPMGMGRGGRMQRPGGMRMPRGGGRGAGQARGQLQKLNDHVSVWSHVQVLE